MKVQTGWEPRGLSSDSARKMNVVLASSHLLIQPLGEVKSMYFSTMIVVKRVMQ